MKGACPGSRAQGIPLALLLWSDLLFVSFLADSPAHSSLSGLEMLLPPAAGQVWVHSVCCFCRALGATHSLRVLLCSHAWHKPLDAVPPMQLAPGHPHAVRAPVLFCVAL